MWFRTLFDSMKHRRSRTQVRRKPHRLPDSRLQIDALEDRCLLSFSPAVSYPTDGSPVDMVIGDFNRDTVLDLAVANPGSVSVLLGNADGTFQPAQNSATGAGPWSLAVGDFNADGQLDLTTTNSAEVSVLLGDGHGSFAAPASIGIGSGSAAEVVQASSVAVGDFNSDGKLDLAVVSCVSVDDGYGYYGHHYYHDEGRVSVLLGTGAGTFAAPSNAYLGYAFLTSVTAADFNRDGKLDLAMANNRGAVDVLLGTGTGSFGDAQNYAAGSQPQSVTMADFNGDGKLDLVTANGDTGTVSVLLGTGAGTFAPPLSATAGSWPYGVVAGDFNGDGRPDVASANNGSNNVSVLLNDGTWPPLPPPSVSINDVTVTEGNTGAVSATFTVTLLYGSSVDATVHFDTANITAMAGSDYAAASGDVIIPAGQTRGTFTVAVTSDPLVEPTETFVVNLSSATNATIADGQGVGTIVDDEPRISISDVSKKEGNGKKTTLFTFTVTLSAAYDQPVTMSYRALDGTAATSDSDYVAQSGTLTFAPGETAKTITIEVKGDSKKEANETFYLDLFGLSSNALFSKNRGLGTILNDD